MYIYLFKMKYIAASDEGWVMMGNRVNIGGKWRWVSDEGRVMRGERWGVRDEWNGVSDEGWVVNDEGWVTVSDEKYEYVIRGEWWLWKFRFRIFRNSWEISRNPENENFRSHPHSAY